MAVLAAFSAVFGAEVLSSSGLSAFAGSILLLVFLHCCETSI